MKLLCFYYILGHITIVSSSCNSLWGDGSLHSFASPGYPDIYPPLIDCVRIITARPGYDIIVHFKYVFQIETSYDASKNGKDVTSNCPNDFVEFRDGQYGFSPLIGRYCGMSIPIDEIKASSGFLWIRFHSDELLEYKGFQATYELVKTREIYSIQHACHLEFEHDLDGIIDTNSLAATSLLNISGQLDCVWRILVPKGYQIAFYINQFILHSPNQCGFNFLEVYSGGTSDSPIRRYCGLTASDVFSSTHEIFVRIFLSDVRMLNETKISALYSSFARHKNCSAHSMFNCGDENCVPSTLICNGRNNCPYGKDEQVCHIAQDTIIRLISSGYSPLVAIVVVVFIVVFIIFMWNCHICDICRVHKISLGDLPEGRQQYILQPQHHNPNHMAILLHTSNNTNGVLRK